MLQRMSLFLAQSRHLNALSQCPLLGIKRTLVGDAAMSAFDPKRTFDHCVCRYLTLRLVADSLPRLLSISYSTVCPSLSERSPARSTAEMWTNTSLPPPPEGCINPYPFVGLNHFTVPVGISVSNVDRAQYGSRPSRTRTAINRGA